MLRTQQLLCRWYFSVFSSKGCSGIGYPISPRSDLRHIDGTFTKVESGLLFFPALDMSMREGEKTWHAMLEIKT